MLFNENPHLQKVLVRSRFVAFLVLVTGSGVLGCMQRDDTTGTMRQIVAKQMNVSYDAVMAESTLQQLGCDELDAVELVMEIEDAFHITISDAEFQTLGGEKGWQGITVLELANLVRGKKRQ